MGPPEIQPKKIDWAFLPLQRQTRTKDNGESSSLAEESSETLQVSNAELNMPGGLDILPAFVSQQECLDILAENDRGISVWEGFEQRRRVQRWSRDDPTLPDCLQNLTRRFEESTGHQPLQISIEEYPKSQLQPHFYHSQSTVTTFESAYLCPDSACDCKCFVATLPVAASVIDVINRPKRRSADCWHLYSENNHSAGVVLDRRSLYVKTKEYLWEWRTRINSAVEPDMEKDILDTSFSGRYVVVKFSRLPVATLLASGGTVNGNNNTREEESSEFGYIPKPEDLLPRTEEMPPLGDLLTVIVTTSPIKSNPSTELLERVFNTFFNGGEDFALKCRKLIICDGCREKNEKVSKRHTNPKQAMRNGIVNSVQLDNYIDFKAALRSLCAKAPSDSPFSNTELVELEERQGYGFALRHSLRECVKTPFVIVIQHDRTFMRPCPIYETVRAMWHHRNIKYVGMSMRSNLTYRDIFLGKYGRQFMDDMAACTLRPPELALDAGQYGPNSESSNNMDYAGQEKLRENIQALIETYRTSQQNTDHLQWLQSNPVTPGKSQLSLTPTFFWYDNVHISETAHYRDFVFNPKFKMVVRGGFVEDKLSPVIKKTVERFGLAKGHARFGCFLLDDHSGMFFTGHLDGGSYLTRAEKDVLSSGKSSSSSVDDDGVSEQTST
jgi:hypothetical protein